MGIVSIIMSVELESITQTSLSVIAHCMGIILYGIGIGSYVLGHVKAFLLHHGQY